jgi:hypothetical protein
MRKLGMRLLIGGLVERHPVAQRYGQATEDRVYERFRQ